MRNIPPFSNSLVDFRPNRSRVFSVVGQIAADSFQTESGVVIVVKSYQASLDLVYHIVFVVQIKTRTTLIFIRFFY